MEEENKAESSLCTVVSKANSNNEGDYRRCGKRGGKRVVQQIVPCTCSISRFFKAPSPKQEIQAEYLAAGFGVLCIGKVVASARGKR